LEKKKATKKEVNFQKSRHSSGKGEKAKVIAKEVDCGKTPGKNREGECSIDPENRSIQGVPIRLCEARKKRRELKTRRKRASFRAEPRALRSMNVKREDDSNLFMGQSSIGERFEENKGRKKEKRPEKQKVEKGAIGGVPDVYSLLSDWKRIIPE